MREAVRDRKGRVTCRWRHETMFRGRRIELRFAEVDQRIICVGLEIGPPLRTIGKSTFLQLPDDDEIADRELDALTAAEIRLPLGSLVDDALAAGVRMLAGLERWAPPRTVAAGKRSLPSYEQTISAKKKLGRPPLYGPEHFEDVARVYRAGGRAPTKAVASHFGVQKATAAKWVARARVMELLPPA
jgi:hypothetical protein